MESSRKDEPGRSELLESLRTWVAGLQAEDKELAAQQEGIKRRLYTVRMQFVLAKRLLGLLTGEEGDEAHRESVSAVNAEVASLDDFRPTAAMTMADAAVEALRSAGRASHYREILEGIRGLRLPMEAQLNGATLLTAMARDSRIVKVEEAGLRGVYALAEWPAEQKVFDRSQWEMAQTLRRLQRAERQVAFQARTIKEYEGYLSQLDAGEVDAVSAALADRSMDAEQYLESSADQLRQELRDRCEHTRRRLTFGEKEIQRMRDELTPGKEVEAVTDKKEG